MTWEKAYWVSDGSRVTHADFVKWLYTPLADGTKKSLDRYITCPACKHIMYQRFIYFHRANWWFWTKFWFQLVASRVWRALNRRCKQCEFNEKIRRSI